MIYHRPKIAYLHNPRTGGTSVDHALIKKYPDVIQMFAHAWKSNVNGEVASPVSVKIRSAHTDRLPGKVLEYQKKHASYDELYPLYPDYKFYSTVRHPLKRVESWYRFFSWSETDGVPWTPYGFNEWIYNLYHNDETMIVQDVVDSSNFHHTQSSFIGDAEWFKLEEGTIWDALGIEEKHHYAIPDAELGEEWTAESLEMMIDYYGEDFERFGYNKGL